MSSTASGHIEYSLIAKNAMEDFMKRCLLAVGAKETHAATLANCLITG